MAFDPRIAPDPDDIPGRAIRITTAASALATFFSDAPGPGIMENLSNPELLEVWPLRDETSLEGVAILKNSRDLQGDYRADYLSLQGFGGRARITEGSPDAEATLLAEHARTGFRPMYSLPVDHLAVELAFVGHLAAAIANAYRSGDLTTVDGASEALEDLTREHLTGLGSGVVKAIAEHARSATYRGTGLLLSGLLAEIASFAEVA